MSNLHVKTSDKHRINIVQWRGHGDDDDSVEVNVIPARTEYSALEEVTTQCDLVPEGEGDDETKEYYHIYEVDIFDGQVMKHEGRKFKVTIEETT